MFSTKYFFPLWLLFQYFNNVHRGLFRVTGEDGGRAGDKAEENLILILSIHQGIQLPKSK